MEKELYEYDKYMVLRPKKEAKKVNKSLGYCPNCKNLVWSDGNAKAINYKTVAHKVCPHQTKVVGKEETQ